uniref:Uncharacterized protein n=1 Tax=Arion vulgaris TaxID=1028688 RepID=A0A0B7AH02_9EUPU
MFVNRLCLCCWFRNKDVLQDEIVSTKPLTWRTRKPYSVWPLLNDLNDPVRNISSHHPSSLYHGSMQASPPLQGNGLVKRLLS